MNIVAVCQVNIQHTQEVLKAWSSADVNGAYNFDGWAGSAKCRRRSQKGIFFHEQVLAAILEQTRMDNCSRMPRDG